MHCIPPVLQHAQFITVFETDACYTHKCIPLHIASLAIDHIGFGCGQRHGDNLCVARRIDEQNVYFDDLSLWNDN
jgi:hypothetical protein